MATRTETDALFDSVRVFADAAGKIPLLSQEEEYALATAYAAGDDDAGKRLAVANLRFVISLAFTYQRSGVPLGDLIGLGNEGLLHALDKYDVTRHGSEGKTVRFASYAGYWIRATIRRAINGRRIVHSSGTRIGRKVGRFRKCDAACTAAQGTPATDEQIAAGVGIDLEQVAELREAAAIMVTSLDAPAFEDGDTKSKLEHLADSALGPEELVAQKEEATRVREALAKLRSGATEMEKRIIDGRLTDEEPSESHKDIAKRFGRSRTRVQQIEKRLTKRLREHLGAQA